MKHLMLVILATLAACGGSGNGGNGRQPPPVGPFPPGVVSYTTRLSFGSEREPNDTLAMADTLSIPELDAEADYVGFHVKGDINDTLDVADYFVFTAARSHVYTMKLCESSCAHGPLATRIDTSVVYIELLDQYGRLLLSTQGDISIGNDRDIDISAGLPYYLGLFADDTVGATLEYRLEVQEKAPFP